MKAQDGIAFMFYQGEGVPQDYTEAVGWYRKAADQGYAKAQYDLGYMYYYGQGVPQDRAEGKRLFHEAAEQGDENAQRALGLKARHLTTRNKITLSIIFVGSLSLLISSLNPGGSHRNRQQRIPALTGLLGLSYVGLSLYWCLHGGLIQSGSVATALYFAMHVLGGVSLAMLLFIVFPKSANVLLGVSATLFVAFNLFAVTHYGLRHLALRVFPSANGLCIGMSIPSAMLLWLKRKGNSGNHNGNRGAVVAGTGTEASRT
jgi:TPR repeat protein